MKWTLQKAQASAEAHRIQTNAEVNALSARAKAASAYKEHPALVRQLELETLRELSRNANARIYINFDRDLTENIAE